LPGGAFLFQPMQPFFCNSSFLLIRKSPYI
jgi:hypothetical protein